MNKKIINSIKGAREKAEQEISGFAKRSHYAAGLASEGYAGGYSDALSDVLLLLSGNQPKRRNYWE